MWFAIWSTVKDARGRPGERKQTLNFYMRQIIVQASASNYTHRLQICTGQDLEEVLL